MTNKELIQDFIFNFTGKEFRKVNNLSYRIYREGCAILYSYSTPIAIKKDKLFIVNSRRYSVTTSTHCNMLKSHLIKYQKNFIELNFRLLYSAITVPEKMNIINIVYDDYDKFGDKVYYVLFNANDKDYFLYIRDSRYKDFLCKLPDKANSVREALEMLNPIPVEERSSWYQMIKNNAVQSWTVVNKYD